MEHTKISTNVSPTYITYLLKECVQCLEGNILIVSIVMATPLKQTLVHILHGEQNEELEDM